MKLSIAKAADVLLGGGVIAYPTEGIFGLGCLADDEDAILRVLAIKRRKPDKGLILIAADRTQLERWIDVDAAQLPDADPRHPVTWIAPAAQRVSPLVRGKHPGIAIRLTTNPTAASICNAVDAPIVSTSANAAGRPVARNRYVLRRQFGERVDFIVPGDCGPASGPSEIRDLATGQILRPRTA